MTSENQSMSFKPLQRQTNEHHVLNNELDRCKSKQHGICHPIMLNVSDIYIMVRVSNCPRFLKDCSEPHSTLDIVQFGWVPYIFGTAKFSEKPKNIFKQHLYTIKDWCKENNMSLYIENIMSEKLYNHYLELGFKETNQERSLLLPYSSL